MISAPTLLQTAHRMLKSWTVAWLLALGVWSPAQAAAVITITEVGSDIVVTGSGSINTSGLSLISTGTVFPSVGSSTATVFTGGGPTPADLYTGANGPLNFGAGPERFNPTGSGDLMGLTRLPGPVIVYVPSGYVSGAPLSGTSTYAGETFASLGLTLGVYVFAWGSDSLTVIVGLPAAPTVTATAADGAVQLSWTVPNANGPAISGYRVRYRPVGGSWITWPFSGTGTSTTVGGLVNGVDHEFDVAAVNARGTGATGFAIATPFLPPTLSYPTPVTAYTTAPISITPTATSVLGSPSYAVTSGVLPTGLTINATTGVISGTATAAPGAYPVTVTLTQTAPAGTAASSLTVNVVGTAPNPQLVYPDYIGSAGTSLALTPTVTGLASITGYSLAPGSNPLPNGLVLNPSTGVIGGTPTTAVANLDVDVRVDGGGGPVVNVVTFSIRPTLSYAPVIGNAGSALQVAPTVSDLGQMTASYAYTGSLPLGLSFNAATGVISGVPAVAGYTVLTVTLTAISVRGDLVASAQSLVWVGTAPTAIPSLNTWGMLLLAGLMVAYVGWRQRLRA